MSENKYPIGGYVPVNAENELMYRIIENWGNAVAMPQMEGWIKEYGDKRAEEAKPAGAVCDPDFIEFIKNERGEITKEMLSDEWWLTIPPSKRVVIENILIAYDQMAGKLNGSKPAAYER